MKTSTGQSYLHSRDYLKTGMSYHAYLAAGTVRLISPFMHVCLCIRMVE